MTCLICGTNVGTNITSKWDRQRNCCAGVVWGVRHPSSRFQFEPDQLREVPFGNPAPGIVPRRRAFDVDGAVPGLLPNWRDFC